MEIKEIKESSNIVDVISKHIELRKKGYNYVGKCPFHDDKHASLVVYEGTQTFKCFGCGGPNGMAGDSIDFLRGLGYSYKEAFDEIKGCSVDIEVSIQIRESKKSSYQWNHIKNPPKSPESFEHYRYGHPSMVWKYVGVNGNTIGYVCRFDLKDGQKQVLPFIYASNGLGAKWVFKGVPAPRPLYNLDLIYKHQQSTILLVEGEKTADAAQKELNPEVAVVTTWMGGANGINKTEWSVLDGRNIAYWPDHDTEQRYGDSHKKAGEIKPWYEQPGNKAMLEINKLIKHGKGIRKWVNVPDCYPHKWDAADKEWNPGELKRFIKENLINIPKPE